MLNEIEAEIKHKPIKGIYEVCLKVEGEPFIVDIKAESPKDAVNKAVEIYYDVSVEEIESGKEE